LASSQGRAAAFRSVPTRGAASRAVGGLPGRRVQADRAGPGRVGRVHLAVPPTFLSDAFVASNRLPGWLRPVAGWNPVSSIIVAPRDPWGPHRCRAGLRLPAQHPILLAAVCIAGIIVVFMPLAISRQRKAAHR
jgi:hypothetical protein